MGFREGGCLDHFQGICVGAGAPLVFPPSFICARVVDEKGPCDYLGELLECIVMQSCCHSTFTFQASDRCMRVEECFTCLKTGLLDLAGGHTQSTAQLL